MEIVDKIDIINTKISIDVNVFCALRIWNLNEIKYKLNLNNISIMFNYIQS